MAAIVTLIGGSVGSGKTTWVQAKKTWGDLVLDTDMFWFALMGGEHYPQPVELLPHVLVARDAVIASLAAAKSPVRAWVISAGQCRPLFDALARKLGAGVIVINTPRDECLRRVGRREYPARGRRTWTELAAEWHDNFEIRETDKLVNWKGADGYRPLGRGQPLAGSRFGFDSAGIRRLRTTGPYRSMRRAFLAKNPLCRPCGERGYTVAAREIDHVVPVHVAPDLFWDQSNWQPICVECHKAKSAAENRRETSEQAAWRKRLEAMA